MMGNGQFNSGHRSLWRYRSAGVSGRALGPFAVITGLGSVVDVLPEIPPACV
jgi:hypothetical protein